MITHRPVRLGKIKMTLLDDSPRFADYIGVPTFYCSDVVREDAGNGNARVWNCVIRGGVLVPQCELIIPAPRLLVLAKAAYVFAADLCQQQTVLHTGMHH